MPRVSGWYGTGVAAWSGEIRFHTFHAHGEGHEHTHAHEGGDGGDDDEGDESKD